MRARLWGCELSHIMQHTAPCCPRAPIENGREGGTHSAVRSLEAIDLLLGAIEFVLRSEWLQNLDNIVPELLVVLVQENNKASGLAVERRRDVENGLLDELLDLGIRDGGLLVELVVCATLLHSVEDGLCELGRSHCW